MAQTTPVLVHFKDMDSSERILKSIEKRCEQLRDEFHEVARFEITVSEEGAGYSVQGHVTGKNTDIGTHAKAGDAGPAADALLDKIERQLRRIHDKRIYAQRRDARRDSPKRTEHA